MEWEGYSGYTTQCGVCPRCAGGKGWREGWALHESPRAPALCTGNRSCGMCAPGSLMVAEESAATAARNDIELLIGRRQSMSGTQHTCRPRDYGGDVVLVVMLSTTRKCYCRLHGLEHRDVGIVAQPELRPEAVPESLRVARERIHSACNYGGTGRIPNVN